MRVLVAITCVIVIAAAGWYGYSEWLFIQEESDRAEERDKFDRMWRKAECEAKIAAWDAGKRKSLMQEHGSFAEEIVDNCRFMVRVYSQ